MKNIFYITNNLFFKWLSVLCVFLFFATCNKNKIPPQPVFDLDTPGGEVVALFEEENTPRVVFFYNIDENGNQTQEQIGVAEYYSNQQERLGGGMKDGKRDGKWYAFFPDGSVQVDAFYIDGIEHGDYIVYRENGNPYFKGHYDHGICDGTWRWYDENGNQTKKIKADKKTIACEYCTKCLALKIKN